MTHKFSLITPNRTKSPSLSVFPPGTDLSMELPRATTPKLSSRLGTSRPLSVGGSRPGTNGGTRPASVNSSRSGTAEPMSPNGGAWSIGDLSEAENSILQDEMILRDYGDWATAIFKIADLNRNGKLSINEMSSMLQGTEHQGFVEWLLFHRNEMFKFEDKDMSGTLEKDELSRALRHFHLHVKNDELKPLADENEITFVARSMIENMYRTMLRNNPPSFAKLFETVDTSNSGTLEFQEVEFMIRKVLNIPSKKVSRVFLQEFFNTIDRNNNGTITQDEFCKFMMVMSNKVSKAFVAFPPPETGDGGIGGFDSWGNGNDGGILGSGYAWPKQKPYWLQPLTTEEKIKYCRSWHTIGGYTSISQRGAMLHPKEENNKIPGYPPLPDIHTALAKQIESDIEMKIKRENTSWDGTGPRYQCTKKVLENYHSGRVLNGKDGFYCDTRFHGKRERHKPPILLKGIPVSTDEARFMEQRNSSTNIEEPLFMETLPIDIGVYDRLCNVTTTSRLYAKIQFADDRAQHANFHGKRKGSKPGYKPL
mmetsp:Transcript_35904/g.42242  ORF Transcript_35904/g.42242 Transcript_35904/m.42242 type:complete len:537 (-) Transcript_35904:52-1662(-)